MLPSAIVGRSLTWWRRRRAAGSADRVEMISSPTATLAGTSGRPIASAISRWASAGGRQVVGHDVGHHHAAGVAVRHAEHGARVGGRGRGSRRTGHGSVRRTPGRRPAGIRGGRRGRRGRPSSAGRPRDRSRIAWSAPASASGSGALEHSVSTAWSRARMPLDSHRSIGRVHGDRRVEDDRRRPDLGAAEELLALCRLVDAAGEVAEVGAGERGRCCDLAQRWRADRRGDPLTVRARW